MTTPNPHSLPLTPEDLLAEAQERLMCLCKHINRYSPGTTRKDCYRDAVAFLRRLDLGYEE